MTTDELVKRLTGHIDTLDRLIVGTIETNLGLSGDLSVLAGSLDRLRSDVARFGVRPTITFITNDLGTAIGQAVEQSRLTHGWRGVFKSPEGTIAVVACIPPVDAGFTVVAVARDGALAVASGAQS